MPLSVFRVDYDERKSNALGPPETPFWEPDKRYTNRSLGGTSSPGIGLALARQAFKLHSCTMPSAHPPC